MNADSLPPSVKPVFAPDAAIRAQTREQVQIFAGKAGTDRLHAVFFDVALRPATFGGARTALGRHRPCRGKAILPRTLTGWFHRIRIAAGLPRITLRNLRHTSVSVMLRTGIPASTVAAWHRHDVRMTTTVYNRVYDESLTAAASAIFGTAEKAV